ncbi:hypothetical protein S1361_32660 [Streptomyces cyanogenus]|uniref:Uncharacterized protein n=1 Tax=Streptomyces cyanogenus TaxID=80860 RepID=A0ABX7U1Y4_STRCY|nr:hypothetical protein S1361_32660 [Streptomyces cyanogenus]
MPTTTSTSVATLVREDGIRAQTECRETETDFGPQILNGGDHTAAQRPTSAERSKAERSGRIETPRETLRESVRHALAGAASEEEFLYRLAVADLARERAPHPARARRQAAPVTERAASILDGNDDEDSARPRLGAGL